VLGDPAIGEFQVQTLVNPTNTELHRSVEIFFRSAAKDDLMLFHFAGHGFLDDRNRLRFAARDTEEQYLSSTALLTRDILEIAENSLSRRNVFLVDCCYSARFLGAFSTRGDRSVHLRAQFPIQGKGTVVLAASGDLEYALEDRESSIFIRELVRGLRSGAADADGDGWVSVTDLYSYVYERLRDAGAPQTPRLLGEREGDLIIARGRAPHRVTGSAPPRPQRPAGWANPPSQGPPTDFETALPHPPVIPRYGPDRRPPTERVTPQRSVTSSPRSTSAGTVIGGVIGVGVVLGGLIWLVVWLATKTTDLSGAASVGLWVVATVFAVAGILAIFRRQILWGLVLIVFALLIGPGAVSAFT